MYDPLISAGPGNGEPHTPSYWAASAGPEPQDDGPINSDRTVEVAIIGAGYTGLAAGLYLAREQGIEACVLEANRTGWGCSGRNGGFALKAGGRLSYQKMIKRWGEPMARRVFDEIVEGLDRVRDLIRTENIDCDAQPEGHLWVAHRPEMLQQIESEARFLRDHFGYRAEVLSASDLVSNHFSGDEAYGALRFQEGFGVHPLKLAYGYQRLARAAGCKVHGSSPVIDWQQDGEYQVLVTPGGRVRAKKVICATNGYTPPSLHPKLKNRTFPVLSNVIVTRPLTERELSDCRFQSSDVITDTRTLRFYYRKLPDNRLLIGGRSAITGQDADNPRHNQTLIEALQRKFPALDQISYDYNWGGWVCISYDDIPHVFQTDPSGKVLYAMGYGGSGVSFSVQAGKRLAEKVVGITDGHDLPILNSPLPKFPFAPFRRLGQRALYHYYYHRDEHGRRQLVTPSQHPKRA
ncbi:NAD(P)/FAD-dependent oxidoreductase [Motiliproteus sp.]|uniref:NAD(P)/FAD-dependent oxidoreductase n=1 Tax=Motiliproteus sp. TaxID=1898955 RepID=UPI003BAC1C57